MKFTRVMILLTAGIVLSACAKKYQAETSESGIEVYYQENQVSENGVLKAGAFAISASTSLDITIKNSGSSSLTLHDSYEGKSGPVFSKIRRVFLPRLSNRVVQPWSRRSKLPFASMFTPT